MNPLTQPTSSKRTSKGASHWPENFSSWTLTNS